MPEWPALLLILLASLLPGRLALLGFAWVPGSRPARLFAALTLGLLANGWLALLLAELGAFSLPTLAALWLLLTLILIITNRHHLRTKLTPSTQSPKNPRPSAPARRASAPIRVLFLLWLAAALWLFFRPHEFVLGGADAGVYVNQAASIARNGSILVDDPTLAALDPALVPALLRERPPTEGTRYYLFPGFNVADGPPAGRVIPDFYPLHPVWQAVAFALGGVRAALLLPGLWALLGSVAVALALRPLVGWPGALLALGGLALNALQIWFARYPVAEMLNQYLLWAGLWALGAWLVQRKPVWGLLAGLALGQVFFVRIDTFFLLAVPAGVAFWLWLREDWRRSDLWFFLPMILMVVHAFTHAVTISGPYFARIGNYLTLMLSVFWYLPLAGLVVAAVALFLLSRNRHRLGALARWRRPALLLGVIAILLLAVYGWFIRPAGGQAGSYQDWYANSAVPFIDHENLIRVGWYLSPVGVGLGVAGAALVLWRLNRRTAPIFGVGAFFALLYLWRIQANPHQVYAMRRYVPVLVPFFTFTTTYLLAGLGRAPLMRQLRTGATVSPFHLSDRRSPTRSPAHLATLALAVLWLGGLAWSARGFVSQVDHQGLIGQLEALDGQLEPESVLLFNDQAPVSKGDIVGTPLHYLYGHDVFTVREPDVLDGVALQQQVDAWQASGREVVWVGDPTLLDAHGIAYTAGATVTIQTQVLENTYEHKPTALTRLEWVLPLHEIDGG